MQNETKTSERSWRPDRASWVRALILLAAPLCAFGLFVGWAWREGAPRGFIAVASLAGAALFSSAVMMLAIRRIRYVLTISKAPDGNFRIAQAGFFQRREESFKPDAIFRAARTSSAWPHLVTSGGFRFAGLLGPGQREEILTWLNEGKDTSIRNGNIVFD